MFYVYALLDLRKPGKFETPYLTYLYEPFYIGKGSNDRVRQHLVESIQKRNSGARRTRKHNMVLKMQKLFGELPYVKFECDSEQSAFAIEAELTHLFELLANGGILTNVDYGGRGGNIRSAEVRSKLSESKKLYTFSEEHLANLLAANRLFNLTHHKGAKRTSETKQAIAKTKFGESSKIANQWKLTDPSGHTIVFKGGLINAAKLFNLSEMRLNRFKGKGPIPEPTHSGHINERVLNCTGWSIEKLTLHEESTFCFVFSP